MVCRTVSWGPRAMVSGVVLGFVLGMCASCAPTRYESFKPPGAERPWTIKADESLGGTVTVKINDVEVIKGQVPLFGSREVEAEYQRHKIKMALTKEISTAQGDLGHRAIVLVDGVVAARFSW